MKIEKVFLSAGKSGFFFDDQAAIKKGASHDGFAYTGLSVTERFKQVRVAGECVSVQLLLSDGSVAVGDCAAVQYSGAGGRDPLFLASEFIPLLKKEVVPFLTGLPVTSFREMANRFDTLSIKGRPLHTAARYGLTQALLHATALSERKLMCEVVCAEYHLPVIAERVPIFGQSGDNRYENADKMILKGVEALPHALINNVDEKLGRSGEKLLEYVAWLAKRIRTLNADFSYQPAIHIDVYGTFGLIFGTDYVKMADYFSKLEKAATGFSLYIEGPVDVGSREGQIMALSDIRRSLKQKGVKVKIVADEWCNTQEDIRLFCDAQSCDMIQIKTPDLGGIQNIVESVLYCKRNKIEAYQGGTCNETDVSARTCVHLAMAARAERILAKPGMGFDEGYMIVNNEMERILTLLQERK
ncbi:MAG: methylaspartate ammonia-lyase [Elusimicrobia bacterium RIFOXYB2_FULL_49_7]|nr:MAG: methylaspartate ammonia-lyase [Elusimicrobia bacterium RIFOXYB2_FULL_49_7]